MTTFQPLKILVQNLTGEDGVKTIKENLANEKLAKQLNQMFQGMSCPDHPENDCLVLVNLGDEMDFLRVVSSCCDTFKTELEGLAEPQKNYSASHH